jgi:hypothetical protein
MLITTVPKHSIRQIAEVSPCDGGARITFRDGFVAFLGSDQASFEQHQWLAEWSRSNRPVGVVTDGAARIIDLSAAHDTGVAWVQALPTDAGRYRVAFWAYSPLCALTRDHPEFDRIHATLNAAVGTTEQVWVATCSEETVDDEPDEEGLVAALPKIMDVRPMSLGGSTNGESPVVVDRPPY